MNRRLVATSLWLLQLLGAAERAAASPLDISAAVEDCLKTASVPLDVRGSDDWAQDVAPFNLRLNFTPVAIAVPTTIPQIQDAVRCGAKLGVKTNAKCGGHSYASFGLGGEDGHLTIELDRMDAVVLDNATGLATIQGGARLGHVIAELYGQGKRDFSHGTCPGVGVAGHSLHGGFGVSSHTKGLAVDFIRGATVVLANATVVNCSATENPELFWALRGAGSSFGVVAQFTFSTFVVPDVVTFYSAAINWKRDKAAAGLKAFQDFAANNMPPELNLRMFITKDFANFEGLYWGNKTALKTVLAPLLNKTSARLVLSQQGTWLDQAAHFGNGMDLNQTYPYNMHETFYSSSLYTNKFSEEQIDAFVAAWYDTGKALKRDWYAQIDVHGGKNNAVGNVAANATSYAHREFLFMTNFYDRIDAGAYANGAYSFLDAFTANLTATLPPAQWGQYVNYPDPRLNQTAAQRNYWGHNLDQLQRLKASVDPNNLFHYPQGIQLPDSTAAAPAQPSATAAA
ncbi:FAD-binding, type 2 [Niveomyces insectorum RCEF 264]|uniref:FAD-binding, type 2 n=1 Tax=Niveomyces insectorum RCEF 264 TaxID=1081102 RepID=A0A167Y0A3_9HYPO|nr:FAD-binding, type 2 [Niveomyces insectorum RCEF 264]